MEPLALLPAYANETVANIDRAPPAGMAPDPRNAERQVLCRTRYAQNRVHEIRVDETGRLQRISTGDLFETTRMFPGVRGWDERRRDGRALFTVATDGTIYAGDGTALASGPSEFVELRRNPGAAVDLPDVLDFWHHSSFVNGAPVLCAGEIATHPDGRVWFVSNFSGHYRPGRAHLVAFLERLAADGVDMARVTVEVVVEDPNTPSRCFTGARFLATRGEPAERHAFTGRY
jgi:hypothetical protein